MDSIVKIVKLFSCSINSGQIRLQPGKMFCLSCRIIRLWNYSEQINVNVLEVLEVKSCKMCSFILKKRIFKDYILDKFINLRKLTSWFLRYVFRKRYIYSSLFLYQHSIPHSPSSTSLVVKIHSNACKQWLLTTMYSCNQLILQQCYRPSSFAANTNM